MAELPKYSGNQDEMIDELAEGDLSLGWRELYLRYRKDDLTLQAGTLTESFGSGMVFRSYEDVEFDEDHRLEAFMASLDKTLKLKAVYGAVANEDNPEALDLAYGLDAYYPVYKALSLGASAVAYRNHNNDGSYNQREIFGTRLAWMGNLIEANAELATSRLSKRENNLPALEGSALYGNISANLFPVIIGMAAKRYENFSFRLQDLPLANYHNEPLDDNRSGLDEMGAQGWINWTARENLSLNLDYSEAWNLDDTRRMNDLHSSVEYSQGSLLLGAEYSHIEKQDDEANTWQKELIPALSASFPFYGKTLGLKAEHKLVQKEKMVTEHGIYQAKLDSHWEPHFQADYRIGKVSLSASVSSHWSDMGSLLDSRYWTNLEARFNAFSHTSLTLFVGKEAGGKVCRNGVCRYVAPFEGLKLDLTTRF